MASKRTKKTNVKKFKVDPKKPVILKAARNIKMTGGNKYITGILYLMFSIFFTMAAFGLAGNIGVFVQDRIVMNIIGYGFILLPITLLLVGLRVLREQAIRLRDSAAMAMFILAVAALLDIYFSGLTQNADGVEVEHQAGGLIGKMVGNQLLKGFDIYFSTVLLVVVVVIAVFMLFDPKLESLRKLKDRIDERMIDEEIEAESDDEEEEEEQEAKIEQQVAAAIEKEADESGDEEKPSKKSGFNIGGIIKKKAPEEHDEDLMMATAGIFSSSYVTPPLSLLGKSAGKPSTGDIRANANLIQRTLANFGVAVEMDEISIGPTVTRYAMKPAQGVRLSKIASLQNELALALAAKSIRIEAPIPGRSLVGVEVPNTVKSKIGLGTLLAEPEFNDASKPLLVSLGKGVSGKSYFANIGKMPHALIAGATGAGKSVTIHNIVMSLLYKNGPDMLRFIMVDPKRVEMTMYKKIPHLLTPVITDPKKAVLALKWAVKEMERRYDVLQKAAVRDLDSYHQTIVAPAYKDLTPEDIEEMPAGELPEKMPYIVVIIDELSDIMSQYPRELEASIVRLAQMSRAVGIHLLLATQRPSVNVITGLIKANIPTRLALKVASQIDSRTILDNAGAEKLLGYGDMLYKGEGANEAVRIQCPYVSEDEVKGVVAFIQKNYKYELEDTISLPDESLTEGEGGFGLNDEADDDPLYEEAKAIVIASEKASTSYLQRRLSIGYSRAARIIDMLEERGVVGEANGSKPRDVLVAIDEDAPRPDPQDDQIYE